MKRLGLIGGPGLESAAHCVRQIDDECWHRFGTNLMPDLVVVGLQIAEFRSALAQGDPAALGKLLEQAVNQLAAWGAQQALLCSSPLHAAVSNLRPKIPVLGMAAPVIAALKRANQKQIGILGAMESREEDYWRRELAAAGIHDVLAPVPRDRTHLAGLITGHFERGLVSEATRADALRIAFSLRHAGTRAAIVCSPALAGVLADAVPVFPLFDAAELHALAAVDWLGGTQVRSATPSASN